MKLKYQDLEAFFRITKALTCLCTVSSFICSFCKISGVDLCFSELQGTNSEAEKFNFLSNDPATPAKQFRKEHTLFMRELK